MPAPPLPFLSEMSSAGAVTLGTGTPAPVWCVWFWCSLLTVSHETNEQINKEMIILKINFLLLKAFEVPQLFLMRMKMKRDICDFNFYATFM